MCASGSIRADASVTRAPLSRPVAHVSQQEQQQRDGCAGAQRADEPQEKKVTGRTNHVEHRPVFALITGPLNSYLLELFRP